MRKQASAKTLAHSTLERQQKNMSVPSSSLNAKDDLGPTVYKFPKHAIASSLLSELSATATSRTGEYFAVNALGVARHTREPEAFTRRKTRVASEARTLKRIIE